MEIVIDKESRFVEIWLTRCEKEDAMVRERLKPLCTAYQSQKYLVAVFCSGGKDLYPLTCDLLLCNRTP